MAHILNRAKVSTATVGAGSITMGAAVPPYQSWTAAGAVNGLTYAYLIQDVGGAWEIGTGVYTAGVLTRTMQQSSTGSLLNLSGSATVASVARVSDFHMPPTTVLRRQAALSVPATTILDIPWDQIFRDDLLIANLAVSATTIVIPAYISAFRISMRGTWAAGTANTGRHTAVVKNGAVWIANQMDSSNESGGNWASRWFRKADGDFAAGDSIKATAFNGQGTALNFSPPGAYASEPAYIQFEWIF